MKTYAEKPSQLVPIGIKEGNSQDAKKWRESNIDYYIDRSSYIADSRTEFEDLYKHAAGYLDRSAYTYITNPFHTNADKSRSYPAKLRNYDIISPIMQMLMGEKSKRKSDPIVIAINSDIVNVKAEALKQLVNQELEQLVVNELNQFVETGFISREVKGYEDLQTTVDSIKDAKAITGQQALNYIYETEDVKRKLRQSFYDVIVTSYAFSKKDVRHGDVVYTSVSPIDCGYTCSRDVRFVEDGEAAYMKYWWTLSDIIDEFYEDLTPDEVKRLEQLDNRTERSSSEPTLIAKSDTDVFMRSMRESGDLDRLFHNSASNFETLSDLHEVAYVNWKSKTKIGKVEGVDIFGNPYEAEVEEGYKPRPDEKVTWKWVNQVWEGYRLANELYVRIRAVPFQRGKFNDPSACKLLINGMTLFGRHYFTKSPVKKLLPYQEKYNAVHWHLEKTMNKNKDKLTFIPRELIPDDEDMDMFDMMYYADADGFLFGDEVDPKKMDALKSVKVLDLSLKEYLGQLWQLLEFIRQEAEDVLGITRQRKGQTFASDGKATTEQSIFQSAIISEELFLEFEEYEEREYKGLLDLSKYAWKDGKKAWFVDSSKRRILLDVLGPEHRETEYDVTVVNGREQQERLERLRQNAQAFIQNAQKPSIVAKMENDDNIENLIDILEKEEQLMEERAAAAQQAEQEIERQKLEQADRHHTEKMQMEMYKSDNDVLKSMQIGSSLDENSDNDIQREEISLKREDQRIAREKINADILINREKNATALKNKVVGENNKKKK